ncbi:MAG: helix-turn-helix domain-containing protein [Xenococcus sp. (in: cyanobacteria)]
MKQLRGFRFRFYPTPAQRLELAQTFGCGRFIYNWALSLKYRSIRRIEKKSFLSRALKRTNITQKRPRTTLVKASFLSPITIEIKTPYFLGALLYGVTAILS